MSTIADEKVLLESIKGELLALDRQYEEIDSRFKALRRLWLSLSEEVRREHEQDVGLSDEHSSDEE